MTSKVIPAQPEGAGQQIDEMGFSGSVRQRTGANRRYADQTKVEAVSV